MTTSFAMKNHPNRKSNRLKGYDYSQNGYYFVTICTKNYKHFFGKIKNTKMILNEFGEIVKKCWLALPNHYKNCVLDEFIIMPNHLHGIIAIENINPRDNVGNGLKPFPTGKTYGLSEIIRGFKTFSSKDINLKFGKKIFQWQKSFYDHIIRNEKSLFDIRKYIQNNPLKWELEKDRDHLSNIDF